MESFKSPAWRGCPGSGRGAARHGSSANDGLRGSASLAGQTVGLTNTDRRVSVPRWSALDDAEQVRDLPRIASPKDLQEIGALFSLQACDRNRDHSGPNPLWPYARTAEQTDQAWQREVTLYASEA
jgi:hypothetical protein